MQEGRWQTITASQYEWERTGLDFVRAGLPDHDPYRAWANFEFQTRDGSIYEVDLLVLTKRGFWLVELKGWPGRVTGDAGTWIRTHDGRRISEDNPLLLANRKAKALVSLLRAQRAAKNVKVPFLEPLVFLSHEDVDVQLTGTAVNGVLTRDRAERDGGTPRKGILDALVNREGPGIRPSGSDRVDTKVARALGRAMDEAGIRRSQRSRRLGDYLLGELIEDGPGYQDRIAEHAALDDDRVRVRQYTVAGAADEEERDRLRRAAKREYRLLKELEHEHILPVLTYREHETGPALLFKYPGDDVARLDHYLAARPAGLPADEKLDLLRQIADAVKYAHRRRVVHRALGPQSVLVVTPEGDGRPSVRVHNWQVGVREASNTSSARVTHVEDLVEAQGLVYMAPEALADQRATSPASDVFSLGCLAFHLFAGRPPAGNPAELAAALKEHQGLRLSSVVDGVGPQLEEAVRWATHPDVSNRIGSAGEFLEHLDLIEEELTAPDRDETVDPLLAKRGQLLEGGFEVERELGQGATAKALLVKRDGETFVLKVALDDHQAKRLHGEAEALRQVRSEFIVALREELEVGGRPALLLDSAGDATLADRLRKTGVPTLEMLGRFGDDLLSAIASLERHGIAHRDIKPDNVGVRSLSKQKYQLVLFDFSLADAPLDDIRGGTPGYRDPFLANRKPQRWDPAADRYSAGATLHEMCLGDGAVPQWGDGRSDPALTDDDLALQAEQFPPAVREGLVGFFEVALHRDPAKRFGNAEDMRREWQRVFEEAGRRTVTTPSGEVEVGVAVDRAELKTVVAALDLTAVARHALERAEILTARDLTRTPVQTLHFLPGAGSQTRREIVAFAEELRKRFPDLAPKKISKRKAPKAGSGEAASTDAPPAVTLETLLGRALGADKKDRSTREALLGLSAEFAVPPDRWPDRAEVAEALGVSPAEVGRALAADRRRWGKDTPLNALRTDIADRVDALGGVMTVRELIGEVRTLRPDGGLEGNDLVRAVSAAARAAVETEIVRDAPRFTLRRTSGGPIVVRRGERDGDDRTADALAGYAERLGERADELAAADPLLPPLRGPATAVRGGPPPTASARSPATGCSPWRRP